MSKHNSNREKKGSFLRGLMKLILVAVILFLLFITGVWLWNTWHYNPALDGDVYPGTDTGNAVPLPQENRDEE